MKTVYAILKKNCGNSSYTEVLEVCKSKTEAEEKIFLLEELTEDIYTYYMIVRTYLKE